MPDKDKGGRPSKIDDLDLGAIELLASKGFTDKELSQVLGVSEVTFNAWKKKSDKFLKSLKDGKSIADSKVMASLYQKAIGWKDEEGKSYPPDTTAAIFWLKNRMAKEWREKQELEVFGSLAGLLKEARERSEG